MRHYDVIMELLCDYYGVIMVLLWCYYDIIMELLCVIMRYYGIFLAALGVIMILL